MLPRRVFTTADAALASLALQDHDARETMIRVTRHDLSVIEGLVLDIDADGVTLSAPAPLGHVTVTHSEIRMLEVRAPDRTREWLLAGLGAVLVTSLLVGVATVAGTEADFSSIVVLLCAVGAGVAPFVLARTPLGRWLHRWRQIYGSPPRAEG